MEFIVITYPKFFAGEADVLSEILRSFSITLHLRKPNASINQYSDLLDSIPRYLHKSIVLHGAYELSEKYELKGLHFSTSSRGLSSKYPDVYKSTSCHSLNEVLSLHKDYDSLFLSPIFPSISKVGYSGDLDLREVYVLLNTHGIKNVVALGGVDASNVNKIDDIGFSGFASLGAVWGSDPENQQSVLSRVKGLYYEK